MRGYEILKLIAKSIEESGTGTKGMYLETSKQFYDAISSCEKAKLLRLEYENQLKSQRRLLKKKRINAYHIKNDELTNEPLKVRTAEFSHIRSVAMYKFISDSIDNGLIVNKETHKIITAEGVNDENELLSLCQMCKRDRNKSMGYFMFFTLFCFKNSSCCKFIVELLFKFILAKYLNIILYYF